jgi:hypothetical protein
MVPGKMICGKIDEDEHRSSIAMFGDHVRGSVEEEAIGLQIPGAEVVLMSGMLLEQRGRLNPHRTLDTHSAINVYL